jgi:hypothetical protein
MTNREFLESVAKNEITEDIIDFANEQLVKLDERNAKRKDKPSKTALENAPIKANIVNIVSESQVPLTAKSVSVIHTANFSEITTQKASSLLTQLVKEGTLAKGEPEKKTQTYVAA